MRKYISESFGTKNLWPIGASHDARYWQAFVDELGVEIVDIIKVRDDGRSVLVVDHPTKGRCVLKGSSPVMNPRQGHANESLARRVSSSTAGIFPDVYEVAATYTLEEFVIGVPFRRWMAENPDLSPVEAYFESLREWSIESAKGISSGISAGEIRAITRQYIDKCFSHYRYLPFFGKLKAVIAVRRKHPHFSRRIHQLWEAAGRLRLPAAVTCGDMGVSNIIVETSTSRLHNIDYESISAGHWGFDAAYFVSSVCKNDPSPERRRQFVGMVLTDAYLGGPESGAYFRDFADLLIEISQTVARHHKSR